MVRDPAERLLMDQEDFFQEAVNRHLSNQVAIRGLLGWVVALLVAVVLAVVVGSWVIYHAIQNPGASPF